MKLFGIAMRFIRLGLFRSAGTALILAAAVALAAPAAAQTTGAVSGTMTDQNGGVLPGVTVVGLHTPTGTTYEAISDASGRFVLPNVRVGGPYLVTAKLAGFQDTSQKDIYVQLGAEVAVNLKMGVALAESITVVGAESPIINPSVTGAAQNLHRETIESLPTVGRSINDFARINPHFQTDAGRGGLVVAGKNYRYNAIQIDGAVTNDLFGLSSSGTPGGGAGTSPFSLDAIDEIQLVVAPYDVRMGGFTGGGINAVTRSGSNNYHGTAYFLLRNDSLVGDGAQNKPIAPFSNKLSGGSFGGRLIRDKVFFFGTAEHGKQTKPSGFSVNGSSGVAFGHQAEIQRVIDILKTKYSFDPGGLDEQIYGRDGNKVFGRVDFNLGKRNQLTVRHSWVKGRDEQFGSLSSTIYSLPNTLYGITNKTNSTVGQLNSTVGSGKYNELRLVYSSIDDFRDVPQRFPTVQVFFADNTSVFAGTERSSHANTLLQDSFELTDDFTFELGAHAITVGTHNEFFKFANLFTGQLYGEYLFSSVDQLDLGVAQGYTRNFSLTSDPFEQARFGVKQWGFYVGDRWRTASNLSLTLGARVDLPRFADKPLANPRTVALYGIATDSVPSPTQFSPRFGFNWDATSDAKNQIRGGVGVFTGRTPYVWLANNYSGTGIQFGRLSLSRNAANAVPFIADPDKQYTVIPGAVGATTEYALVDPDFKFPAVLRSDIAYDRDLGFGGLVATAELLYADTLQEILYKNINLKPTGQTAFDGRPTFTRIDATTGAAYLLTNTTEGSSWTTNFKLERPLRSGFFGSASYLYNNTTAVNDGTSSTAASQFGNNPVPGDPNDPPVTLSNYSTGHRVNLVGSYSHKLFAGVDATVSVYYNGQSGLPFKYIFASAGGDINGDTSLGTGSAVDDLLYVPASASEVIVTGGTWEQLNAFIEGDEGLRKFRGKIVDRNATRLPWRNTVDFRVAFGIPAGKAKVELTAEVQNFLNMFKSSAGTVLDEVFPGVAPIRYGGLQDGKPVYNLLFLSPTFVKGSPVDLASRWQGQFGLRIRF